MIFKRVGSKPFGVQLNKAEQKVLNEAINQQILENDLQFQMDNDSAILEMLHVHFGFGKKRLKKGVEALLCRTQEAPGVLRNAPGRRRLAMPSTAIEDRSRCGSMVQRGTGGRKCSSK